MQKSNPEYQLHYFARKDKITDFLNLSTIELKLRYKKHDHVIFIFLFCL